MILGKFRFVDGEIRVEFENLNSNVAEAAANEIALAMNDQNYETSSDDDLLREFINTINNA